MQSSTVVDTTDNVRYYWCPQAMNDPNRCTSSNCGSNTYSKTFINSEYWASQRDYQFYDADFLSCLPTDYGSGEYRNTYSPSEKACADTRCKQLCYDTYGSNCASSTAEVSNRRLYTSYCYIFKGDCSNAEISTAQGFAERNARIESYGAIYREASATTFFCHEYTRRRMSEVPAVPQNSHGRELALANDPDDNDVHFQTLIGLQNEFLKHGTYDGQKVNSVKMQAEVPDASHFYGAE
jgi:hypothetical protein